MREIEETPLPGVGVRHDYTVSDGTRVGVITHRTGRKELLIYDRRDPDTCAQSLRLDEDDEHTLSEMLGAETVSTRLATLAQEVEGLAIDWVRVPPGSPYEGATLRHLAVEPYHSAMVVAIQRDERMHPAPGADFALRADDVAVLVGTLAGIEQLASTLRGDA